MITLHSESFEYRSHIALKCDNQRHKKEVFASFTTPIRNGAVSLAQSRGWTFVFDDMGHSYETLCPYCTDQLTKRGITPHQFLALGGKHEQP